TVNNPLKPMYVLEWDLNRIIGNLLDNAIEAVERKGSGKVELIIDSREKKNIIEVKTCGIIIPEEIRSHIFEKGYTSKDKVGHGLGLAICKDIVENYQGEINIMVSRNEEYTSFQAILPVKLQSECARVSKIKDKHKNKSKEKIEDEKNTINSSV
ncbi:MAG: sensor histidine kinase, partial [Halanaerobiales bacterium]